MQGFNYLVVLSHGMDDVPLRLFAFEGDAERFAKSAEWEPPEAIMKSLELSDMSTPCSISIVKFFDGIPCERKIVRDYEEETGELEEALENT